ncbi:MAG: hypothetical protein AAGA58_18985 [Verrucomicrobiota bacterium]
MTPQESPASQQDTDEPPKDSWVLLECPSCGVEIRTSVEHAGKTLKCPACGIFVECLFSGASKENSESAEVRQSVEVLEILDQADKEIGSFKGLVSSGETKIRKSKSAIRDKRKKKRIVASEEDLRWDVVEKSKSGKDEYFEYIDGRTGEHFKVKRGTPKEKEETFLQRYTRNIAILGSLVVISAVIALIATGFFKGAEVGLESGSDSAENAPEAPLIDGAKLLNEGIPPNVLPAEAEKCLELANEFFEKDSIEERLEFVRNPEEVRPMMEEFYQRMGGLTKKRFKSVYLNSKFLDHGSYILTQGLRYGDGPLDVQFVAFEQTGKDSFLLDWPVSEGYQPMFLEDFQRLKPTEPMAFRVKAKISEHYTVPFQDKLRYQAVSLTYPGDFSFQLIGYVDRTASWAPEFIGRLELEGPSVILNLKYPKENPKKDIVIIDDLVSGSWFF